MSVQAEADLILKLYELRREPVMRQARDWYFRDFNPESVNDVNDAFFGEHSAHLRMVLSYWEMAAALVNKGAISVDLFNDTNGEQLGVFSKIEPFLAELRATAGPRFAANLEKLIDAIPEGRKQVAMIRERFRQIRAELARRHSQTAHG